MNSYGELINILPDEGRKLIRTRESIIKKIINAELSITFNETCIRENLLPTYTLNIYIYIYIYIYIIYMVDSHEFCPLVVWLYFKSTFSLGF